MTTISPPATTPRSAVDGAANEHERADVIDELLAIVAGSALDEIRASRPATRANAQASYEALFAPQHAGTVTLLERFAVATFVAGLHAHSATQQFYADKFAAQAIAPDAADGARSLPAAVSTETELARVSGPYGFYPAGPLSVENRDGLRYRVTPERRDVLGARLSSALEHAHLLVFRPREASPDALQALLNAGWSTTDIVTLSQLVAFLTFQIRVVAGLELLA